jgi:hypothetical protein
LPETQKETQQSKDRYPNEMAINELIRDSQEHPDKDTQEHPHRVPIELNDEEMRILSKVTAARGLPFNPKKRAYSFLQSCPI